MKTRIGYGVMAGFLALSVLWGGAVQAATPYANATLEGALAPGVYGRIEIGNAPPPPLVYVQPVLIQRPPVYVQQPPLYLHVPPGHAKKWAKHCAKYNACNRPVYFVKVQGDDPYERRRNYEHDRDRDHQKEHGKRKGYGTDHDNDHKRRDKDHDRG